MDGFLFYKTIIFLKTKLAEVILNILKAYHIEAEQQTGKKLKHIKLNIDRK